MLLNDAFEALYFWWRMQRMPVGRCDEVDSLPLMGSTTVAWPVAEMAA
jgi:hypothetical protein